MAIGAHRRLAFSLGRDQAVDAGAVRPECARMAFPANGRDMWSCQRAIGITPGVNVMRAMAVRTYGRDIHAVLQDSLTMDRFRVALSCPGHSPETMQESNISVARPARGRLLQVEHA